MPFGPWANFATCKRDVESKQGYSDKTSDKVCGKLKHKLEKAAPDLYDRDDKGKIITSPHNPTGLKPGVMDSEGNYRGNPHLTKKPITPLPTFDKGARPGSVPDLKENPSAAWIDQKRMGQGRSSQERFYAHGPKSDTLEKADWKMYVSKPDLAKIPDKIKEDKDKPPKFNFKIKKDQLEAGKKVEAEHAKTLKDAGVPEGKIKEAEAKIAQDHIEEIDDYYVRLNEMEKPDFWSHFNIKKDELPRAQPKKKEWSGKPGDPVPIPQYESDHKPIEKCPCKIEKADTEQTDPDDPEQEKEIRELRLKSKLSPRIKDLKEVQEVDKGDVKREWALDLAGMLASDREISGTFHKPVIDKENDIIPASAMDKAMDDFMILPTLQEVHTERTVGIITKAWKTGDDEYKFEGKIKPGDDCDDVWKKVKNGEYDGLSIGGRRTKYSKDCSIPSSIRTTPCVTHRLKLYNVSVCSSPVNPEANIDEVNKVAKSAETIKKAETTESNVIHATYDGVKKPMDENDASGVSKSDDDLIVKADIDELTKALGEFSKSVEELNKSFASHFASLTKPQPQSLGGHVKKVENTMKKAEDEEEVQKSDDEMDYDPLETITKAYDSKIAALEEKISKMEETRIQKGGQAVIIPEQVGKDDPILSNLSVLGALGRVAK